MKPLHATLACLLAAGLVACSGSASDSGNTSPKKPPTQVQTVAAQKRVFHHYVQAWGQVSGDSRHTRTLTLPQPGEIASTAVAPGHAVQAGETLLTLVTDPATRAAYKQARHALDLARSDLARTQRLASEHLATHQQVAAARKALADAQASVQQQARLGGDSETRKLKAPADGVVTRVHVNGGDRVQAGAKLVDFTPRQALAIKLGVPPQDAGSVHVGMPVVLEPVYGRAEQRKATVTLVAETVDASSHLVDVLADFADSPGAALVNGAAVSARIQTASFKAWAVPRAALLSDERGSYVYQIEQGRAHRIDVQVPAPSGNTIGVLGKLDPQAPVIALGAYELSESDPVRAKPGGAQQ